MACETCGNKKKKCASKDFTKAVIEINNPESLVLLRKVVIPVSMGDDTVVKPTIGKYRNVILYYEANKHIYLYSSDGIPTQIEMPEEVFERLTALESETVNLQQEIDDLKNSPDVVDIVATYSDLQAYDTSSLGDKDIIRVLNDETHNSESSYYRWNKQSETWTFIGTDSGKGMKTLTSADYNWNSSSKSATEPYNCIAPWLLDYGTYALGENMAVALFSDSSAKVNAKANTSFVLTWGSNEAPKALVEIGKYFLSLKDQSNPIPSYGSVTWFNSDGTKNRQNVFLVDDSVNNLSDPSETGGVLSAKTGKVIKDNVEALSNFSTSEVSCGTWIDGSTIYKKTIDFGALPDNSNKSVSNGFLDGVINKVIKIEGYAYAPLTGLFMDLGGKGLYLWATSTTVEIKSYDMLSSWTECYVTIYYTKN